MTEVIQFTLGMSNAFILRGEKTILVDAGSELSKEALKLKLDELGIAPEEISLIILSHAHVDHYVNLANAKALTGAPLMCHENAAEILRTAGRPVMYPRNALGRQIWADTQEHDPVPEVVPVEPDILLCSEISLKPFGVDGKIIFTPGHSDCSLTILLDDGSAIVADVILSCPMDGNLVLAWFAKDQDVLYQSVDRILEHATLIYSGHGGPFSAEDVRIVYAKDKKEPTP